MTQVAEQQYIALKRMKVQERDENGDSVLENGRPVMRELAPGDLIPEAGSWKNLWREVRAGRVGLAGTPFAGPALAHSMQRRQSDSKPQAKRRRRRKLTAGEVAHANATGQAPKHEHEDVPEPGDDSPVASDSDVSKVELPGAEGASQE